MNVNVMAEGSASQSSALVEVVNAVGDLDTLTHENSGLIERASQNSDRMINQVSALEILSSRFSVTPRRRRTRHGSCVLTPWFTSTRWAWARRNQRSLKTRTVHSLTETLHFCI